MNSYYSSPLEDLYVPKVFTYNFYRKEILNVNAIEGRWMDNIGRPDDKIVRNDSDVVIKPKRIFVLLTYLREFLPYPLESRNLLSNIKNGHGKCSW